MQLKIPELLKHECKEPHVELQNGIKANGMLEMLRIAISASIASSWPSTGKQDEESNRKRVIERIIEKEIERIIERIIEREKGI